MTGVSVRIFRCLREYPKRRESAADGGLRAAASGFSLGFFESR